MSLAQALIMLAANIANSGVATEPLPAWVVPAAEVPPSSSTTLWQVIDHQVRFDHGEMWFYDHYRLHVTAVSQLAQSGSLNLEWSPDHGRAIIHAVTIWRGGKPIDALKAGAHFEILRREKQLEAQVLDGQLSATMQIPGVQVGDTVEIQASVTSSDPTLQGHAAITLPLLTKPLEVGFGRSRLVWRDDDHQHWAITGTGATPVERDLGDWHEVVVTMPLPQQADTPPQAPGRFTLAPQIETSDFTDWQSVSRIWAGLYDTAEPSAQIAPGGDLDHAMAAIAAASPDPRHRIAAAIQLVQDKIRYFAVTLGNGNVVPQPPEQTWANRLGDCKAKTLLLLAMLHKLGIAAEPVLANLGNGDAVHSRVPSTSAFNHVFVMAHVDGHALWLDGTGVGTRLDDLDDVPDYHWVLPIRSAGAELIEAAPTAPARVQFAATIDDDVRGGFQAFGTRHVEITLQGNTAGTVDQQVAAMDPEARADYLRQLIGNARISGDFLRPQYSFDRAAARTTISADGIIQEWWSRADRRFTYDPGLIELRKFPDRGRSIWSNVPIAGDGPGNMALAYTVYLPRDGADITMIGLPSVATKTVAIRASLDQGTWHYDVTGTDDGRETAADSLPELRKSLADMFPKRPRLRTAPGYPLTWQIAAEAQRNHLYDHVEAIIAQWIAEKPTDPARPFARASFYDSIRNRDKAISAWTALLALKADKTYYRARARQYRAVGRDAEAEADLRAANALDPTDLDILSSLALVLARQGKADAALHLLDSGLNSASDAYADYLAIKANVLVQSGQGDAAIAAIDDALSEHPDKAKLLNTRCWIKGLLNRDLAAAADDCTRAIQQSETARWAPLDSRGLIHFRQGDYAAAITDLDAALDAAPAAPGSYFLRALAEQALGKTDAARADYAAAQFLGPEVIRDDGRFGLVWQDKVAVRH